MQAAPYSPSIPNFTPVTLLPPPEYVTIIQERVFDPYKGPRPVEWRGATSVWQAGGIPNDDYTSWAALYIWSRPSGTTAPSSLTPTLETELGEPLGGGLDAKYYHKWVYPQAVGKLYITNITIPPLDIPDAQTPFPGLRGTVYFKTEAGQTGSFNLATETWTFDQPSKAP
jgi:hypothetical protein